MMDVVTSHDGTRIAYDRYGSGPTVLLVPGALQHRALDPATAQLARLLAAQFTVLHYDRRGRGDSGDTPPYAVEREIEDVAALIDAAGGQAFVFGHSSGAVLALRAAAHLGAARITRLALYEPPFDPDTAQAKQDHAAYVAGIRERLARDQRDEALAFFMGDMVTPDMLEGMRASPEWMLMRSVAHTLAYDNAIMGDGGLPGDVVRAIAVPTLVLNGDATMAFMQEAAQVLARAIPGAQHRVLEGQTHGYEPAVLAPVLAAFFAHESRSSSANI
jgi:pimeloyl-ACP methyl ester carboxylesterase